MIMLLKLLGKYSEINFGRLLIGIGLLSAIVMTKIRKNKSNYIKSLQRFLSGLRSYQPYKDPLMHISIKKNIFLLRDTFNKARMIFWMNYRKMLFLAYSLAINNGREEGILTFWISPIISLVKCHLFIREITHQR